MGDKETLGSSDTSSMADDLERESKLQPSGTARVSAGGSAIPGWDHAIVVTRQVLVETSNRG